ncbi:MAG: winged helix-turn-helix domain-containing protein [Steroidobacteraceae bacterium]
MKSPKIRLRVDFNAQCAIGPGKIQLLEAIERTGSLSQAAREMEMSYRRGWLLLDSMNNGFDQPVVSTQTGGKDGGGAELTAFGKQLVAAFHELEASTSALAARHMGALAKHVVEPRKAQSKTNPAVKRRTLVRAKRAASN